MKFFFLNIKVRNGEYEYNEKTVCERTDENLTPEEVGEDWASEYYSGEPEKTDNGYYFNGGEVHVSIGDAKEITKVEYDILKKYL